MRAEGRESSGRPRGLRLHGGTVRGIGHGFAGAKAVDDPRVLHLHHIGKRFLGGIALTDAVFEVGDFGDEAIFFGAPENVNVIMRRVHGTVFGTYVTTASSSNGVSRFLLRLFFFLHKFPLWRMSNFKLWS